VSMGILLVVFVGCQKRSLAPDIAGGVPITKQLI